MLHLATRTLQHFRKMYYQDFLIRQPADL